MKTVLVATPCYDGKVVHEYSIALLYTAFLCAQHDINIIPAFVNHEALLPLARNTLLQIAVENESIDYLFFIDSDESWHPEQFLKLVQSGKDVIAGTARRKDIGSETYAVRALNSEKLKVEKDGLIKVDAVGTGFLCLSREAFVTVHENAELYIQNDKEYRMCFPITIENGFILSEDIAFCKLLKAQGFDIFFDPSVTCNHFGQVKFIGDFMSWARAHNLLDFA